ncbi:MAG TPA: methylated-DNA--[protein]-cysteine S-methyltransferase [Terracidiphilus sp.]|jgi:methylated-DNA-[protein]-cysteine S-methyltransferase|nr:methylated-DNA--[protein]-cysteine S-methyltransferase [Terracidiphilus sp.]
MGEVLHLLTDLVDTPIGVLRIVADNEGKLRIALFTENDEPVRRQLRRDYGKIEFELTPARNPHGISDTLGRYFAGDLGAIDSIEVQTGGTVFQRKVWQALRGISCGTTTSYGRLAQQIGHPTAVRAVGLANGANPIAVIVPCHRVIGANGSLTGYGGGIERKRWLLDHERQLRL